MTMLSVVSVPDGIVLSSDSCVNSNPNNKADKIFFRPQDNIGFMVYENALLLKRLTEKYNYDNYLFQAQSPPVSLDVTRFSKQLVSKYKEDPKNFCGVGDTTGYVGVVAAGYEEGKPKVATFVIGARDRYLSQGSKEDKYRLMNYGNQEVNKITLEVENTPIDVLSDYFGACFATIDYVGHLVRDKDDFSKMSLDEAIDYSVKMINYTIGKMQKEVEDKVIDKQSVSGPIDTLIIPKVGKPYWHRHTK